MNNKESIYHMKYLKIFTILLLFICPIFVYGQHNMDSMKYTIKTFETALKNKDIAAVEKTLSPNFSISTASLPDALSRYLSVILRSVDIETVISISDKVTEHNDLYLLEVEFCTANNRTDKTIIAFDKDNKIVSVDYFDRMFGASRLKKSELVGGIPFRQSGESIILTIKLNDSNRYLNFLLDTGADGSAIRKDLADSLNLNINHSQNATVVGGKVEINISGNNTIYLSESIILRNQNIAIFENMREGFDGIIGLSLINQYITKIDFDKKQIYLYTLGSHNYMDEGLTLPINKSGNLLSVPGSLNLINKKTVNGNFIIDTGANYHLIAFSQFVRKNRLLLSGFKPEGEGSTRSLGIVTPVFYGKAYEFKLGDGIVQNNMPVTLQASNARVAANSNTPDGSIGILFFSQYNFTIDLLKKEIHLVPRK